MSSHSRRHASYQKIRKRIFYTRTSAFHGIYYTNHFQLVSLYPEFSWEYYEENLEFLSRFGRKESVQWSPPMIINPFHLHSHWKQTNKDSRANRWRNDSTSIVIHVRIRSLIPWSNLDSIDRMQDNSSPLNELIHFLFPWWFVTPFSEWFRSYSYCPQAV